MDLKNLNTFLMVVNKGSFTKAAEELGYVQSTVTAQIKHLEAELEFPLFDRIGKSIFLTSQGREFIPYAHEVLTVMREASFLGLQPEQMHGTIRLGVLESILQSVILWVLPQYTALYKNINIQIKTGHIDQALSALKKNEIDLAYISGELNDDPQLERCYLRREELVFVSDADNPLTGRKKIPLSEIIGQNIIFTELTGFCYQRFNTLCAMENLDISGSRYISIDSTHAVSSYLKYNPGIAFLPEYAIGIYLESGILRKLDVDVPPQYYYTQILAYCDKWRAPYITAFLEEIKKKRPEKNF